MSIPKPAKKKCDADWMNTYADMVTLLLCFFVLLAGVSEINLSVYEQIQAGMAKGIGNKDVMRPIELIGADLSNDIQSLELGETIGLGEDSRGLIIEFASSAFYKSGSSEIREEAYPALRRITSTLRARRYSLFNYEIQGHTDDSPIHNERFPSNWELSSARAASVARFMIDNGIDKTRLKVVGYADIIPKVANRDPYGKPIKQNQEINRRVVIRISPYEHK